MSHFLGNTVFCQQTAGCHIPASAHTIPPVERCQFNSVLAAGMSTPVTTHRQQIQEISSDPNPYFSEKELRYKWHGHSDKDRRCMVIQKQANLGSTNPSLRPGGKLHSTKLGMYWSTSSRSGRGNLSETVSNPIRRN